MPKPIAQSLTHYRGMVVAQAGAVLLAESQVEGRPTVNDMATLLAHAVRSPLAGKAHRPRALRVRGHPQWRELFAHLALIGLDPRHVTDEQIKSKDLIRTHHAAQRTAYREGERK